VESYIKNTFRGGERTATDADFTAKKGKRRNESFSTRPCGVQEGGLELLAVPLIVVFFTRRGGWPFPQREKKQKGRGRRGVRGEKASRHNSGVKQKAGAKKKENNRESNFCVCESPVDRGEKQKKSDEPDPQRYKRGDGTTTLVKKKKCARFGKGRDPEKMGNERRCRPPKRSQEWGGLLKCLAKKKDGSLARNVQGKSPTPYGSVCRRKNTGRLHSRWCIRKKIRGYFRMKIPKK